jgi:hypothetical protein
LPTAYWLARPGDALTWQENQFAGPGPFDLDLAPVASTPGSGGFLGDYQGMASASTLFRPLFTQANADALNRPDICATPAVSAMGAASTRFALPRHHRRRGWPKLSSSRWSCSSAFRTTLAQAVRCRLPALNIADRLSRRVSVRAGGSARDSRPA